MAGTGFYVAGRTGVTPGPRTSLGLLTLARRLLGLVGFDLLFLILDRDRRWRLELLNLRFIVFSLLLGLVGQFNLGLQRLRCLGLRGL